MKYLIFSDVHGNLEALEAVLAHGNAAGVEFHICLGDIIGYGADPNECVEAVRGLPAYACVKGNHDAAVVDPRERSFFHSVALEGVRFTESTLTEAGYEVFTALDPAEAIHVAQESSADLFIMDINFQPDPTFNWDGFGLAEWLRHQGLAGQKPIIFITGEDVDEHRTHAERFSPSALFQKPVDMGQLLATIQEFLSAEDLLPKRIEAPITVP